MFGRFQDARVTNRQKWSMESSSGGALLNFQCATFREKKRACIFRKQDTERGNEDKKIGSIPGRLLFPLSGIYPGRNSKYGPCLSFSLFVVCSPALLRSTHWEINSPVIRVSDKVYFFSSLVSFDRRHDDDGGRRREESRARRREPGKGFVSDVKRDRERVRRERNFKRAKVQRGTG